MDLQARVDALERELGALRQEVQRRSRTVTVPFRVVDSQGRVRMSVDTEPQEGETVLRLCLFDASGNPQLILEVDPRGWPMVRVAPSIRINNEFGELEIKQGENSCSLYQGTSGMGILSLSSPHGSCSLSVSDNGSVLALHSPESDMPGIQLSPSSFACNNTRATQPRENLPSRGLMVWQSEDSSRMWLKMFPSPRPVVLLGVDATTGGSISIRDAENDEVFSLEE